MRYLVNVNNKRQLNLLPNASVNQSSNLKIAPDKRLNSLICKNHRKWKQKFHTLTLQTKIGQQTNVPFELIDILIVITILKVCKDVII